MKRNTKSAKYVKLNKLSYFVEELQLSRANCVENNTNRQFCESIP